MATDPFICPYAGVALTSDRPCAVGSCSFNLADKPLGRAYRRCFLNYVQATGHNPHKLDDLEQIEYGILPLPLREQIAKLLLDFKPEDEVQAKATFYISLFSIMAHDTTVSLAKRQHSPVPYRQCCICGTPTETLWFPKGSALPPGHGYCSWTCWQDSPPPLLALTKILEVDISELTQHLPFPHGQKSRLVFTQHLTRWILGDTPLK